MAPENLPLRTFIVVSRVGGCPVSIDGRFPIAPATLPSIKPSMPPSRKGHSRQFFSRRAAESWGDQPDFALTQRLDQVTERNARTRDDHRVAFCYDGSPSGGWKSTPLNSSPL